MRRLFRAGGGAGGFTPPLLSVGSPTSFTNDSSYNSWPSVVKLAGGDLITAYTKGSQHSGANDSDAVVRISTNSGATWGSEITACTNASLKVSAAGIAVISTGRILLTLWRDDETSSGTGEAGITYSDDGGATWHAWIGLSTSFDGEAFGAGPPIELGSGDLLVTVEGSYSGDPALHRGSHTLLSTDHGATWGSEVIVRDYDVRPYYETCLLLLDNADLLAVHRCAANAPGTHYISLSTDSGATWGTPYAAFDGIARPTTIQGTTGTLLAVTRRNSDAAAIIVPSQDRGVTWGTPFVLDATMFESEYGCAVELASRSYLAVYGSQPTSSTSNADIKQVAVTER